MAETNIPAQASETNGRFGHHPEAVIDFLIEVEEIESERLDLTGFGHEADRVDLNDRIWRTMEFRVGGDHAAITAKNAIRDLARRRGLNLTTEVAYPGQPVRRLGQ